MRVPVRGGRVPGIQVEGRVTCLPPNTACVIDGPASIGSFEMALHAGALSGDGADRETFAGPPQTSSGRLGGGAGRSGQGGASSGGLKVYCALCDRSLEI